MQPFADMQQQLLHAASDYSPYLEGLLPSVNSIQNNHNVFTFLYLFLLSFFYFFFLSRQ